VKYKRIIEILEENGFGLHRHGATSHRHYRCEHSGRVWLVTVAGHGNDDCPIGTLMSIIRQSGLKKKKFR
jgi:predicted RNA binding protein YcfA (HicA-like mRNA interferase family)